MKRENGESWQVFDKAIYFLMIQSTLHTPDEQTECCNILIREEKKLKWPSIVKFGSKKNTASKIVAYNVKIDPKRKYQPQQVKIKTLGDFGLSRGSSRSHVAVFPSDSGTV